MSPSLTIMTTVFSGVFVFVISQFVLKLTLEPIVKLRESFGELSAVLLRERMKIHGGTGGEKIKLELLKLSAKIKSIRQAVYAYRLAVLLCLVPNKSQINEACMSINQIACLQILEDDPIKIKRINDELKNLKKTLKIEVDYLE